MKMGDFYFHDIRTVRVREKLSPNRAIRVTLIDESGEELDVVAFGEHVDVSLPARDGKPSSAIVQLALLSEMASLHRERDAARVRLAAAITDDRTDIIETEMARIARIEAAELELSEHISMVMP
jgi:hypothetical protein